MLIIVLMNGFNQTLGPGRGRRPYLSQRRIKEMIEDLGQGQETITVEAAIRRQNISEGNRRLLKQALGQRRWLDQRGAILMVVQSTGLLPRVDSCGLLHLPDRVMHRWSGHWHSKESLLMAPVEMKSTSYCGLEINGGDNNWQPLKVNDWTDKPERRCPTCPDNFADYYSDKIGMVEEKIVKVLEDKPWPEADDILSLPRDSWPIIRARVIHPLDNEEIDKQNYTDQELVQAWRQLLIKTLAQRPVSYEAVASLALECLAEREDWSLEK